MTRDELTPHEKKFADEYLSREGMVNPVEVAEAIGSQNPELCAYEYMEPENRVRVYISEQAERSILPTALIMAELSKIILDPEAKALDKIRAVDSINQWRIREEEKREGSDIEEADLNELFGISDD